MTEALAGVLGRALRTPSPHHICPAGGREIGPPADVPMAPSSRARPAGAGARSAARHARGRGGTRVSVPGFVWPGLCRAPSRLLLQ